MKSANTKTVRFTLDPKNPPRMSPADKARFDALRDEDIDYSDIPDQSGQTGWTRPGLEASMEEKKNRQPAA